jgi:hypothetical protein
MESAASPVTAGSFYAARGRAEGGLTMAKEKANLWLAFSFGSWPSLIPTPSPIVSPATKDWRTLQATKKSFINAKE